MSVSIALAGNPNSGKTTLFNDLTGASQRVGNWPGVTVEKKEGKLRGRKDVTVTDLPGVYSLSPYSPEEVVSRDYLLSAAPEAIVDLVDGTNLERNLFLTTQLLEVGLPVVVAFNMADLVRKSGDSVDLEKLGEMLDCRVIATSALKGEGTLQAAQAAVALAEAKTPAGKPPVFCADVEAVLGTIGKAIEGKVPGSRLRWYSVKLLERDSGVLEQLALPEAEWQKLDAQIKALEDKMDDDSESIVTTERYELIAKIMQACVKKQPRAMTTSDKIDRIVTNRWLALPIFALIMFVIYYVSVTTVGDLVTGFTNDTLFGEWIGGNVLNWMEGAHAVPWLSSLVVDGIIGGVGAVIGFVPQMIILFIFLSFLEDCGYMARVAFIMDRIFRRFGLSGKSFIPMLISMGCGVPGIMATKTIENEKDRRMTIITTTFIPCGAKLPIIALIAGALFGNAGWVSALVYFSGVGAVLITGIVLKKTRGFAGDPAPFVMELPQYHLPSFKGMVQHVWERISSFIVRAGTVIFASSVVIWFLLTFGFEGGGFAMVEEVSNSFLARFGAFIAPIFAPLGFGNWEATVGTISGLVAKENLVSTLAIIQGLSDELVEGILDNTAPLWAFVNILLPSAAAGLSFLLFNMLCAPCFAAIGAIRRQMASGKWTLFAVAYQTAFAYCIALIVYQLGTWFTTGAFGLGTVAALLVLALILFLLLRPVPAKGQKAQKAVQGNG